MITSRRNFLRFGATTAIATRLSVRPATISKFVEPSRFENDGLIRLNSNENAYGPSAAVQEAIRAAVGAANRYPRTEYDRLTARIAASHKVAPEQVLLGCGSTEILRIAAFVFLGKAKQLIQASPTFEAMEHYANTVSAEVISVPLTPSFAHDLDAILARVNRETGLVYICNPNNPTASLTMRKDVEKFIGELPGSVGVVIDEAYHHFVRESGMYASFIDRPVEDERVIVTRTFSKVHGLAGLRLGYAFASPKTIERMRPFATRDNVNAVVTRAAFAALDDIDGVWNGVERNANDRQEFFNQAMARALKPIDSQANFVMMNTFHPAEEVIQHFKKNNILIGHHFSVMDTYIRVSLGTPDEMLAFWKVWDLLPFAKKFMHH